MPLPQSFLLCACEKDGVTWRPEGPERMPVHAHACDYTFSGQGWGEVRRTDHILSQERVGSSSGQGWAWLLGGLALQSHPRLNRPC